MDPKKKGKKPPFPPQEQDTPGVETEMKPRADHGEETYQGCMRLDGRVALVTGGDSGIGHAVALAFAREGADVAIGYLSESERGDAETVAGWVEKAGRRAYLKQGDLSRPEECRSLVESVVGHFERIDILVNNAASQGEDVERFEDIDAERIRYTFASNIESMFNVTRHALAHMYPGSVIINTTSIQAVKPSFGILDYACTKAAIVNFTKGLASHLLERGIRVNAVAPGPVWTPLIAQSFDKEKVANFGKSNPMGRPAQPVELAPAFVFLASEESRFVTGEVLAVTGGLPIS